MKIIKNEFRELFLRNAGYCESENDFPVISVSTLGTFKENKQTFLDGYFNLLKQKSPENILCYGKVHQEMERTCNIISCIYEAEISKQEAEFNMFKRLYPHSLFEFEENVI